MADPIGIALAKTGIPAAIEAAKDFVEKLLGPAAEEAGLVLQDQVRAFRLHNQLRILAKAQGYLATAGIEPNAVPLRTLVPLLDGASLEDDDDMQSLWAGLLANAAGGGQASMAPSFIAMLQQLTPLDAQVLRDLFTAYSISAPDRTSRQHPSWGAHFDAGRAELDLSVNNGERIGIIRLEMPRQDRLRKDDRVRDSGGFPSSFDDFDEQREHTIILTPLGAKFLEACLPPIVFPLKARVDRTSSYQDRRRWCTAIEYLRARWGHENRKLNALYKEALDLASTEILE